MTAEQLRDLLTEYVEKGMGDLQVRVKDYSSFKPVIDVVYYKSDTAPDILCIETCIVLSN